MRDEAIRFAIGLLGRLSAALYALQREPVWRSFDGRVIPVREMGDKHLDNAIRLVMRQIQAGEPAPRVLVYMMAEQARRRGLHREQS
jgi:hypothetical protein